MKEDFKEFTVAKVEELDKILDTLIKSGDIYNPDGVQIGRVTDIEVLTRKNSDGQEYQKIQIDVSSVKGNSFVKQYSVDFYRKFITQLGVKSKDLRNVAVIFKPTGKYKNIGFIAFVYYDKKGSPRFYSYIDESQDYSKILEGLGL